MNETIGTLLIVDDILENVSLLFDFLTEKNFTVLVAQNGKGAIQKAEYAQPDLILLDVMMPDIDGFEVCHILKSRESTKAIPIIFMTALTEMVDKVRGFNLGAADYITKPFQHEEVLARVTAHLQLYKLQQSLKVHADELEQRNLELEAFSRTVAHDLKNPLGVVINSADLLLDEFSQFFPPPANKLLRSLLKSGYSMVYIIDALLLLAGVSGRRQVETHPLQMESIISQVQQERFTLLIESSQAHINLPRTWPIAQGYTPWIREVWANYLSNALKYGGQPPHITLGATVQDDEMIRFWVQDNGAGLTPSAQAQLFTPFTRLHQNQVVEGHGLGLSIVRQIVEKLGGQVGVESVVGQGSTFYFTLPA
ncbi:MAG: hybrid sensor histidine kinase/response regulator, partial [Beggiatoa sp. IS2]